VKVSEEISHHDHYEQKGNDETLIIPVIEGRCSVSVIITPRPSELHSHNATRNAMRSAMPKTHEFSELGARRAPRPTHEAKFGSN
jgi:hypothetical protein